MKYRFSAVNERLESFTFCMFHALFVDGEIDDGKNPFNNVPSILQS
jgi:hypothetical protein